MTDQIKSHTFAYKGEKPMTEKLELNFKDNNIKEVVINGVSFKPAPEPKPTPKPKPVYHRGWVPDVGEWFYFLASNGEVNRAKNYGGGHDHDLIAQGNCYPTREAAEKVRDRRALVTELWREDGVLHEIDWYSSEQSKWYLEHVEGIWVSDYLGVYRCNFDLPYFKTLEDVEAIIEKYGDRLDLLLD